MLEFSLIFGARKLVKNDVNLHSFRGRGGMVSKPATKEIMDSTLESGTLHATRSTNMSSYRLVSLVTFAVSTTRI